MRKIPCNYIALHNLITIRHNNRYLKISILKSGYFLKTFELGDFISLRDAIFETECGLYVHIKSNQIILITENAPDYNEELLYDILYEFGPRPWRHNG